MSEEKQRAPIIEDGKTLDELVAKSPYGQSIVQHERENWGRRTRKSGSS